MPVRKPSYSCRSFSRVTTNQRTPKRTISCCSVSAKVKTIKTTKKSQLADNKNFLSPVIQKDNSLLLPIRRLPDCEASKQALRTKARIPANNGSSNCTIIRSSFSGSRIKWLDRNRTTRSVQCFKFEPQWENCAQISSGTALFPNSAKRCRKGRVLETTRTSEDLRSKGSHQAK